jgi:DNA-binding MarR family transcriptional regulator
MNEPLPPMPTRFRTVQLAYADMISAAQEIVSGTRLTPPMGLILAFLGDQTMSPADIRRYGYFIGTSLTYSLDRLEEDDRIERLDGLVSSDRRRRPVKLTRRGLHMAASIRINLAKTVPAKVVTEEVAA